MSSCITSIGKHSQNSGGYSRIYSPELKSTVKAHRYIFESFWGEIPLNLVIMHTCDNRACTNIQHLYLSTQGHNLADMYNKGRAGERDFPRGFYHHNSRLSKEKVEYLKTLTYSRGLYSRLAKEWGVTRQTISNIFRGKTWKEPDLSGLI